MTTEGESEGVPHPFTNEELAWYGKHLTQLRQSVSGQRLVLQSLGIGFVLGLVAHVAGYALKASATTGLLGLAADLLYALGFALWTGVVVALFVEVIPRVKQRQIKQALDAYEAALHEKTQPRSVPTSRSDA